MKRQFLATVAAFALADIRRVYVDNTTTPVTFWVGNNHRGNIIKLEPLD
jgi:hypothetical protein